MPGIKFALTCACLMVLGVHTSELIHKVNINPEDFEVGVFENMIDHFNFMDTRTFQQRYWVNTKYWPADGSGPNFIYLCGEYACSVNE